MSSGSKKVVLLVEDDPLQLAQYGTELESRGFLVCNAASAEDGIRLVKENRIDVILTDNVLPGITGIRSILEFAKISKAPLLLMTSHYSKETEGDALLLGARCCLKKPLDFDLLDRELRKALASNLPA